MFLLLAMSTSLAIAGEANVVKVTTQCQSTCTFNVTLIHGDKGGMKKEI